MQNARAMLIAKLRERKEIIDTHDECFDPDILDVVKRDSGWYYYGLTDYYIRRRKPDIVEWALSHRDNNDAFDEIKRALEEGYALSPQNIEAMYEWIPAGAEFWMNDKLPPDTVAYLRDNHPFVEVHPSVALPDMPCSLHALTFTQITIGVFYRIVMPEILRDLEPGDMYEFSTDNVIGITRMDMAATAYAVEWLDDSVMPGDPLEWLDIDNMTLADVDRFLAEHTPDELSSCHHVRGMKENVAIALKARVAAKYHALIDWRTDYELPLTSSDPAKYSYPAVHANYLFWRDREDNAADLFAMIVMHSDGFLRLRR